MAPLATGLLTKNYRSLLCLNNSFLLSTFSRLTGYSDYFYNQLSLNADDFSSDELFDGDEILDISDPYAELKK